MSKEHDSNLPAEVTVSNAEGAQDAGAVSAPSVPNRAFAYEDPTPGSQPAQPTHPDQYAQPAYAIHREQPAHGISQAQDSTYAHQVAPAQDSTYAHQVAPAQDSTYAHQVAPAQSSTISQDAFAYTQASQAYQQGTVNSNYANARTNANSKSKFDFKALLTGCAGGLVTSALVVAVVFGTGAIGQIPATDMPTGTEHAPVAPLPGDGSGENLPEAVAARALPSVVAIDTLAKQQQMNIFGFGISGTETGELVPMGSGSGVVLSEDGFILTNNHVVENGDGYQVTIEGKSYDATLVGNDPSSDVAVLKAEGASGLTPMAIGDSDQLAPGQWVMSIGSPFGFEQSVATGIVSATSRSTVTQSETTGEPVVLPNMIQTDAAINPGNSGGALVDSNAQLIGMNTLITSYSGNYSGVGFAIPVNYAMNIAEQIMNGEAPTHAQLGVSVGTVTPDIAKKYDLNATSGALVSNVLEGSAAQKAGVQMGDVITEINGKPVTDATELTAEVRATDPGKPAILKIVRGTETLEVEVKLDSSE